MYRGKLWETKVHLANFNVAKVHHAIKNCILVNVKLWYYGDQSNEFQMAMHVTTQTLRLILYPTSNVLSMPSGFCRTSSLTMLACGSLNLSFTYMGTFMETHKSLQYRHEIFKDFIRFVKCSCHQNCTLFFNDMQILL